MIPNTSFAFYAICFTQYARARMLRQALSAGFGSSQIQKFVWWAPVTDPSLTEITNGSHHGHSSGIGTCKPDKWTPEKHLLGFTHILSVTCMFDHAVALSHALLFPTLGAHWQSLDLRIFQVKYAELQNSHSHRSSRRLGSSVSFRTCRTPLWSCKAWVGFNRWPPVWDVQGNITICHLSMWSTCCTTISLSHISPFSLSDCSTRYSGTFQLCWDDPSSPPSDLFLSVGLSFCRAFSADQSSFLASLIFCKYKISSTNISLPTNGLDTMLIPLLCYEIYGLFFKCNFKC